MDALAMTEELLALLSGPERWDITFCTYLHTLPRSADCRLRWVLPDSPAMQRLGDVGPDQLIDLRNGADAVLSGADESLVEAARNGTAIVGGGAIDAGVLRPLDSQGISRVNGRDILWGESRGASE
jgi:hypothetical protein